MEGLPGSSSIPVTLGDGETASWRYPEKSTDGQSWYRGFAEHFKKYNSLRNWFLLRDLRIVIVTSLGNEFFSPGSKEFRDKIKEQLLEVRKSK